MCSSGRKSWISRNMHNSISPVRGTRRIVRCRNGESGVIVMLSVDKESGKNIYLSIQSRTVVLFRNTIFWSITKFICKTLNLELGDVDMWILSTAPAVPKSLMIRKLVMANFWIVLDRLSIIGMIDTRIWLWYSLYRFRLTLIKTGKFRLAPEKTNSSCQQRTSRSQWSLSSSRMERLESLQ